MNLELNPTELRVIGCLLEKEVATPDHYPLTLNALVNACNQKSNRHPIMELDENTIIRTLDRLRMEHRLAIEVHSSGNRVAKYKHNLPAHFSFSAAETALLCELFLRGAQTAGDLRAHASRLHPFEDHFEVEEILDGLKNHDDGPLTVKLPREPGRRENKWDHLFGGEAAPQETEPVLQTDEARDASVTHPDRIDELERQVIELKQQVSELKTALAELKSAFE